MIVEFKIEIQEEEGRERKRGERERERETPRLAKVVLTANRLGVRDIFRLQFKRLPK